VFTLVRQTDKQKGTQHSVQCHIVNNTLLQPTGCFFSNFVHWDRRKFLCH